MGSRVGREILDRVVDRQPIGEHDGRSGAELERVRLDDGTRLVLKRFDPRQDLLMQLTGDVLARELVLWESGAFDGFPPGVEHPIVAGWSDGDVSVLVMRDLGDAVLGWDRVLTRDECRRIFAAMIGVHRTTATRPRPDSVVPLEYRVAILSPQRMLPHAGGDNPLPGAVLKGWEHFFELVDDDIAGAVRSIHAQPERLAGPMGARSCALLHADLFLVNIALEPDRVTFFDWGIATWGPSWLDVTMFLVGAMSNVDPMTTIDDLVADYRELSGTDHDETAMRLAMLCTLCDLGWNKALDAVEHPDAAKRERERRELAWWTAHARATLAADLVDLS
jgi:hypothetical protein